ncbi:MAG: hypothetical protein IH986_17750 [Planctomycetes bacterium]|nr:hypothetical protein [Planctomycetota bacterium]
MAIVVVWPAGGRPILPIVNPHQLNGEQNSGTIGTDQPCRECGYNLRSLSLDGVCPECGRPVRRSIIPDGLRFDSFRAMRRTRLGIGVWVLALALPAMGTSAFKVVTLVTPLIWGELAPPNQPFRFLYMATIYTWSFAGAAAGLLIGLGVLLITFPFTRRTALYRPKLAICAAGVALLLMVTALISSALWRLLLAPGLSLLPLILGIVGTCAHAAALLLCWIYLMLRLDREHCRRLRLVMWAGLLAFGLLVSELPLQILLSFGNLWVTPVGGVGFTFDPPAWWDPVFAFHQTWARYGGNTCYVLMILCLWAYARTLNTALRRLG